VHDQLIPAVESVVAAVGEKESDCPDLDRRRIMHIELACERSVDLLVVHGYLSGSSEGGFGSGAGSSSGISSASIGQGESLLKALTLLGHRAGLQGTHHHWTDKSMGGGLALGPALSQRHGLAGSIQSAIDCGAVVLDEAQTDYIAAVLGVSSLAEAPVEIHAGGIENDDVALPEGPGNFNGGGDGDADDDAVLLSLVSQVRDLLPDFGEGYVAACLHAVHGSAEQTINALLDGPLPPGLESLDPGMTFQEYQKDILGRNGAAKPAGRHVSPSGITRNESHAKRAKQAIQHPESLTARYLDAKDATFAEKLLLSAAEAQWEYEDEYDDGQDEFLHLGGDGLAELEDQVTSSDDETSNESHAKQTKYTISDQVTSSASPGPEGTSSSRGLDNDMQRMALGKGSRGGRGGGGWHSSSKGRLWVLDGRIYHYSKPGAVEVASEAEARQKVAEAKQAALEIHGLGPGGNVPHFVPEQPQQGRTRGGRGGGGRGTYAHKEKNKAATGNHHRKDRAAQKMSKGMQ